MDGSDVAIVHTRRCTKVTPAIRALQRRSCDAASNLQDDAEDPLGAGGPSDITPKKNAPANVPFDRDSHTS